MLETRASNLKEYFTSISQDDIRMEFSLPTFYKGLAYYEEGHVEGISAYGTYKLEGSVTGTHKYSVSLELRDGILYNFCSCPIGESCKHVVALLLFCLDYTAEPDHTEELTSDRSSGKFKDYLEKLSKKQLADLVIKFAPQAFIEQISYESLDSDHAQRVFNKVIMKIDACYVDFELLYDPVAFEEVLVGQLEKLRGLWKTLDEEVGDMFIDTLEKINDLMNEGYLYDDYYDNIFEGCMLSSLIRDYTMSLPFDKKMEYIKRVEAVILRMEYSILDDFLPEREGLFLQNEKGLLKSYFLEQLHSRNSLQVKNYYGSVSEELTSDEKEASLRLIYQSSAFFTLELAEHCCAREKKNEAIKILEDYLQRNRGGYSNTEELYVKLVGLKKDMGHDLEKTAMEAISENISVPLLELLIEALPARQNLFENIAREKSGGIFLQYLEKHQRIQEAVLLLDQKQGLDADIRLNFFLKNMKKCPLESSSYFMGRIEEELAYTGEYHYHIIADCLRALKKIDRSKADFIAEEIRSKYKRRRNLMAAIQSV